MKQQRSNTYLFWRAIARTAVLFAVAWPIAFLIGLWLDTVFN